MLSLIKRFIYHNGSLEGIKKEIISFIFAIGLILITARLSSHLLIIWGLFFFLFYNRSAKIYWNRRKYVILILIVVFSILNEFVYILIGDTSDISIKYLMPYSLLIIFTVAISEKVDNRFIKWFIFITILEILLGLLELNAGVVSFWALNDKELIESGLLYDRKVYGFDSNSSGFAYRVVFSALLYHKYREARIIKEIPFYITILIGIIISFNRTGILAFSFFIFLCIYRSKYKILLLIPPIFFAIYIVTNPVLWDIVLSQLTRGDTDFSTVNALSERDIVYPFYLQYIKENFFMGYGSFKYFADIMSDGRMFHAHNAYLQTMANNGVPISLLYFGLIVSNINKRNYLYVLPILLMAFFQCLILWGISLPDIIFYKFLFNKNNETKPDF